MIYYRNKILHGLYKMILKPVFFKYDPEQVHDRMVKFGSFLGKSAIGRWKTSLFFDYQNRILNQHILGIDFKNPIGLSAGFDKNAELTDILPSVGFGFAEVGSITGEECQGNPKPRLWRLPESKSLVVHYGLKNDGAEKIAERLRHKKFKIPIGISVAMTNCSANLDLENAVKDFEKAFKIMEPYASYITVNISCPNTQGGQTFMAPEKLDYLFNTLDTIVTTKPVFVKLSPDMSMVDVDNLVGMVKKHRIKGIICTNLTKNKNNPKIKDQNVPSKGGLSGKVVENLSDDLISYLYKKEGKNLVIIGSGGVFSAEDAYKKIRLGASLIQIITGMIYEGPQVISEINRGLVELLKRDGFSSVSEAVGVDSRS
ncbi:MAG: quinone-dependent dihydroorotate dehydrogenase [Patescibacteria group bacterium]